MNTIRSFAPLLTDTSRVLVLGSVPSVRSLEKHQYYGHPTNAFWRIMEMWCGQHSGDWQSKVAMLASCHIALWDVVGSCERKGSADSAIRDVTFNDLRGLVIGHPSLEMILCNGNTAMRLFERYNRSLGERAIRLPVEQLPSTSAANTMPYEKKWQMWHAALAHVMDLSR